MSQAPHALTFGLTDKDWTLLERLALEPLRAAGAQLWVFGSRARGDHRPFSDIDLLYRLQETPTGLIGRIQTDLEESNLTLKVDLVSESPRIHQIRPARYDGS